MNWNIRSKRFLIVLFLVAIYVATLLIDREIFRYITPYIFAFCAAYCGFESWRPSSVRLGGTNGSEDSDGT